MKDRGGLPNEKGDVVRECKAMHEEDFWSSWKREGERGKEERMAKAEKNEEEKGEKRKREEEKEENETDLLKEDVRVLFLWKLLKSLVKGKTWRVAEVFSWEHLLEGPGDLSDCEPISCARVRVVLDVTDVLVSPSSVVTELCDVSPCGSGWEFVEPQSFSFSK